MFDYLDIGTGWQRPLKICKGDRIRISGSVKDSYKLSDGGPWISVEGDPLSPHRAPIGPATSRAARPACSS